MNSRKLLANYFLVTIIIIIKEKELNFKSYKTKWLDLYPQNANDLKEIVYRPTGSQ